ncbi:MAG: LysM peptidoglycan-binding domain-containing protein [Treponema sp.]|jgi:hypothetical protein|nr:LysM peptidoglycan-binding domain-containing protein [Treponema sp.]
MKRNIALITVLLLWVGFGFSEPDAENPVEASLFDTSHIPLDAPAVVVTDVRNNEFYLHSEELYAQAQEKFEEGDYDASEELSNEAKRYAFLSDSFVATQLAIKASNEAIAAARERLVWATSLGGEQAYPEPYKEAYDLYAKALEERLGEQWEDAKNDADRVGIIIAGLTLPKPAEPPVVIAEVPSGSSESGTGAESETGTSSEPGTGTEPGSGVEYPVGYPTTTPPSSSGGVLPAQYTVRSWYTTRDCLWNIASWPWVYGDPMRWTVLYNANRNKLPNPDNPDLILPGMILDIPTIRGETREGMWNESITYTPL